MFLGLITRCKDEFFVEEFVEYYLSEGVDHIYVIDDDSVDKSIYSKCEDLDQVSVVYEKDIISRDVAGRIYSKVKSKYEWMIYVDVDEFIVPKKNSHRTIRDELHTTFSDCDCIKVPWVMMSSAKRSENPENVLRDNVWRWNHDLKHPHPLHKFRCRYKEIEVKCIFKTSKFESISDHHPTKPKSKVSIVDSIDNEKSKLNPFYCNLREYKINSAYLICYHYRIISEENSMNKITTNTWYGDYCVENMMLSDHAEIMDSTLSVRQFREKIFIIGFNRVATRSLHYFFKNNGLASVHWDSDNLAKTMLGNRNEGKPLLEGGRVVNETVNSAGYYADAQVFSDMTYHALDIDAKDFYVNLHEQYPDSKFILNIRDVEAWIKSRNKHGNGMIVDILMKYHDCDHAELENIWRRMWKDTIDEMTRYFDGNPNFLLFDIESQGGKELCNFFKKEMLLDPQCYSHVGNYEGGTQKIKESILRKLMRHFLAGS